MKRFRDTSRHMPLKGIRELRGMTQQELAEKSGVSEGTISAIEMGNAKKPLFETIVRLAHVLKVKPINIWPIGTTNDQKREFRESVPW